MTPAERLEALVGSAIAEAVLNALREDLAMAPRYEPLSRWLTVDQTAAYLGTTEKAVRRRIAARAGRATAIRQRNGNGETSWLYGANSVRRAMSDGRWCGATPPVPRAARRAAP